MVCLPEVPANAGVKRFPDIPGPEKTPPDGNPIMVSAGSNSQYIESKLVILSVGLGFTTVDITVSSTQPLTGFVYVYVILRVPTPAIEG